MADFIGDALSKQDCSEISAILSEHQQPVLTPDEYTIQTAKEVVSDSSRTTTPEPKKKRGRKPGKSILKTPPQTPTDREIPPETREKMMNGLDYFKDNAGDKALAKMRKKMMKYFKWQFIDGDKLRPYFEGIPPIYSMGMGELQNLESNIKFFLDDDDDLFYAEWALIACGGLIENTGPSIAKTFKFVPGAECLGNQDGLSDLLREKAKIKGNEGLYDDLMRLSIDYGYNLTSSPVFKSGIKFASILRENSRSNHLARIQRTKEKHNGL